MSPQHHTAGWREGGSERVVDSLKACTVDESTHCGTARLQAKMAAGVLFCRDRVCMSAVCVCACCLIAGPLLQHTAEAALHNSCTPIAAAAAVVVVLHPAAGHSLTGISGTPLLTCAGAALAVRAADLFAASALPPGGGVGFAREGGSGRGADSWGRWWWWWWWWECAGGWRGR